MQTIPHSTDELRQEAAQLFTDDNPIFSPDMKDHYVRNRVMNAESGDLSRQLAAYFQKQLDERSDGFPLVRDYSEAVQFYNGFLKKRVKAQLAAAKHYDKDVRAVVTIPLCLRLRKAITLSETEHFAELSTDGKPMAKYLKERNWGFATACYVEGGRGTSEGKKIMLTGIIYPELKADTI
jgi:hypothetical protein